MSASVVPERALADFLAIACEVLFEATGEVATPAFVEREESRETIAVSIRARGDFQGITWSFPLGLVRRLAECMIPGLPIDRALLKSAGTELANILMGRAAASLEEHGLRMELEPPTFGLSREAWPMGVWATISTVYGSIAVVFHPR